MSNNKNYLYKTPEFAVSDAGIHLLRSGYNHKTIAFSEVNQVRIEKGFELHNWLIVLILGFSMFISGVWLAIQILGQLPDFTGRSAKMILLLFLPVAGLFFIYNSLRRGIVLRVSYANNKKDMFPLAEIRKQKQLVDFNIFLTSKLANKVQRGFLR